MVCKYIRLDDHVILLCKIYDTLIIPVILNIQMQKKDCTQEL